MYLFITGGRDDVGGPWTEMSLEPNILEMLILVG